MPLDGRAGLVCASNAFISYNTRGFSAQKQLVCQKLVTIASNKIPIICTQETFILRSNAYKISKALPNFHIVFKAAKKDTFDKGRPKNGMFIAIPAILKEKIIDVSPNHHRVQAALLTMNDEIFLIVNTYFPTDTRNNIAADDIQTKPSN